MKTIKEKVEAILRKYPECRESDARLVSTYLYYEIGADKLRSMSGLGFIRLIANGEIPAADAITRVARKLKEENPDLRGANDRERRQEEELIREKIVNGIR